MKEKKKNIWTPKHIELSIKNLKKEDGYHEYERIIKSLGKS